MDINHGWLDNLLFHPVDHQQQTFVTKHDLALLHKKIIATDLIVQKYQEANKALVALQVENDQLRQQIEQITNECCIFGKQVTECTQECDHLKEGIEKLNAEKRDLNNELRALRDENMNYYHEIMILKQYESLKEVNDQSTKIIERQQKEIARLQLRAQRSAPIVYKPIRSQQETTETEKALDESKRSVRELKLALGRLMNYISNNQIEVPSSLHIRPVLKAHDINDDFLEKEGEYVLQRERRKSKRTVQPVTSADHGEEKSADDDDENEGLVDVPPAGATTMAPATSQIPLTEPTKETPSSLTLADQKKKNPGRRKSKKKQADAAETPVSEVEDLAHELEMAIAKADPPRQENISHLAELFGEDIIEDKPVTPAPVPAEPVIFRRPSVPRTKSSITFTLRPPSRGEKILQKALSFLSDDDEMDTGTSSKSSTVLPPPPPPSVQRAPVNPELRTSISFLSEDDEHEQTFRPQSPEYPPPPKAKAIEEPQRFDPVEIIPRTPPSTIPEDVPSLPSTEPTSNSEQSTVSMDVTEHSVPSKETRLNPAHVDLVFRLLHVLTDLPVPCNHLRLSRRRIPIPKPAQEAQSAPPIATEETPVPMEVNVPTSDQPVDDTIPAIEPTPMHPPQPVDEANPATPPTAESVDEKHTDISATPLNPPSPPEIPEERTSVIEPTPMDVQTESVKEVIPDIQSIIVNPPSPAKHVEEVTPVIESTPVDRRTEPVDEVISPSVVDAPPRVPLNGVVVSIEPSPVNVRIEPVEEQSKSMQIENDVMMREESEPSITRQNTPSEVTEEIVPSKSSVLTPSHLSMISRLLVILTTWPMKPVHYPHPYRRSKDKVIPPRPTPSAPTISRPSRSPPRMPIRSLSSIRKRIAECNRPTVSTRKRTTQEPSAPASSVKRLKTVESGTIDDEFDRLKRFLLGSNKEIPMEMKNWIDRKIHEDSTTFLNQFSRRILDFFISRANLVLPLVKQLHPSEDSLKLLILHLQTKSNDFPTTLLVKLKESFELELEEKTIVPQRMKMLNRLYLLICSIGAPSSNWIYTRLFDIGSSLSKEILFDALTFVREHCSTLIASSNASNRLLHRILFDHFTSKTFSPSIDNFNELLLDYLTEPINHEDFIRSSILLARHQSWTWIADEFSRKCLFPLFHRFDENPLILIVLQNILFIFKDDERFRQDRTYHQQLKDLLLSSQHVKTREMSHRRDQILYLLQNCS